LIGDPFGSEAKFDGKSTADGPNVSDFATAIVYAAVLPVAVIVKSAAGK
jgi:hypothetical protein